MPSRPIITLTTDFGLRDDYVGVMKGVMLRITPDAHLVDLTHHVQPQDITHGALVLEAALGYFPDGTVHLAVVDPGVGSDRAAVAVQAGTQFFVAPDNGLLTCVLQRLPMTHAVLLDNPKFHSAEISRTFHGRDIFAPVAAHLAAGVPIQELGSPVTALQTLRIPQPHEQREVRQNHKPADAAQLRITVLHIDHFGNAITNLTKERLEQFTGEGGAGQAEVTLIASDINRQHTIALCDTYACVEPGEPLAYFGSTGRLEIAVRNGSARDRLGIRTGSSAVVRRALR